MLEPGGELDLALEPLGPERHGELGVVHLEGDGAVMLEVLGEKDRGHAAAAELPFERVAVSQTLAQLRHRVGHRSRWVGVRPSRYRRFPRGASLGGTAPPFLQEPMVAIVGLLVLMPLGERWRGL
jgi:hypothetical protein